jgi:lipopolysaccharide assembly outer membrane protein LptD (OstA)
MSSRIGWRVADYGVSVGHTFERYYSYNDDQEVEEDKRNNGINLNLSLQVTKRIGLQGGLVYDLDEKESSQYLLGLNYNKDCWNLSLGLRQDVRPIESTDGADSILENTFSFQLNFVPFGGVGLSSNDLSQYANTKDDKNN